MPGADGSSVEGEVVAGMVAEMSCRGSELDGMPKIVFVHKFWIALSLVTWYSREMCDSMSSGYSKSVVSHPEILSASAILPRYVWSLSYLLRR
jgi:hypothetical protein